MTVQMLTPAAAPGLPVLPYRQSIAGCLSDAIGAHGLSSEQLDDWIGRAGAAVSGLQADYRNKSLQLLRIVEDDADICEAESALAKLSAGADTLIFFGTGGSGLGGQTLAQFSGWNQPGNRPPKVGRPRTRFHDNLDPVSLARTLDGLDFTKARFVVTSKSGGTSETLAQVIATLSAIKTAGLEAKIPELFLGITEPSQPGKANGLRALLSGFGIPMLDHPTGIGGRFSCLTVVGLAPAIARGMDVRAIRAGARQVVQALLAAETPHQFAPAIGAATAVALTKEKGICTLVIMPYADRLARLSAWFVQLWAESLGKGGEGTSAIAALGPVDQHSQLQLFMDGPREHYLTLIRVPTAGTGPQIDADLARKAGLGMMADRFVGDMVDAQAHAIAAALGSAGRPVRTIDFDRLDETALGALLMHFMLETIIAGRLLGIDPFDQPAVELAKVLTRERLSASGEANRKLE